MTTDKTFFHRDRQTKIVATLGPASSSKDAIRSLFEAGADVFRLNFSHGKHADHAMRYQWVREVERQLNHPIGILMDLQGPKLKLALGKIEKEMEMCSVNFEKQNKYIEAQRIRQRTKFDLEMLEQTGFVKGIENYSRHLTGRKPGEPPPTLPHSSLKSSRK